MQPERRDRGARASYTAPVQQISLDPITDWPALGRRWQALEAAADGGFFRSWAFLGCQADSRFSGARLLSVTEGGADHALALIGAANGSACLNETGNKVADSIFIEWNGMLVRRGHDSVLAPALAHALRIAGPLTLSGIDTTTLAAAQVAGWLDLRQTRFAPCLDLQPASTCFLATLSPNARAQIRRSIRLFGPDLQLVRAETLREAHEFFEEMVALHQATWQARGKPGAFAEDSIRRFHHALIDRTWPSRQTDLLRIATLSRHIGTLYNFVHNGRVLSYQSGFHYGTDKREKPGLACHTLAINHYTSRALQSYDFLAGPDRYKKTLASSGNNLHWARLHSRWSARGILSVARIALGRFGSRHARLPP